PTNAQILKITANEIDISWQDNAGHQANDYAILRAVNHGSFAQVATLPPTSRTPPSDYEWSDTGLSPSTYYDYMIEALNVSGYEEAAEVSGTTLTTAPAELTASGGDGLVNLSWKEVPGATSYNVYRGAAGAEFFLANVTAPSFADTTVADGSVYYY